MSFSSSADVNVRGIIIEHKTKRNKTGITLDVLRPVCKQISPYIGILSISQILFLLQGLKLNVI